MRIGNVEAYVVSDGEFRYDGGGVFGLVPRVLWEKLVEVDALNRVPLGLNCLLLVSHGRRILVDTGYGDKVSERAAEQICLKNDRGLIAGLAREGFDPADIDIVICTHLHSDHCGGNTSWRDGMLVPTFPRAEYWVQRFEWAEAQYPNERTRATYLAENLQPVADRIRLIAGDTRVTPEIRCVVARGHTHSHQVVMIESDGQSAIFMAEAAPLSISLEHLTWIAAFDVEPLESIETRRRLRDWAVDHDAIVFLEHDVRCPVARVRRGNGSYCVVPVVEK